MRPFPAGGSASGVFRDPGRVPLALESGETPPGAFARALAGLLGAYKTFLSPLLPRACRFEPTCSEYFREAVLRKGFWRGAAMGLKRIVRCQPFCRGGFDPVV